MKVADFYLHFENNRCENLDFTSQIIMNRLYV